MRRKEREITDRPTIESIIRESSVCRLALSEDDKPYVVPLCFGYEDNVLYFHSARKGKKLDILKQNDKICFEFDVVQGTVESAKACEWDVNYRSVIGFGKASLIDDPESKRRAIDIIFQNYSGRSAEYTDAAIKSAVIIKVEIDSMTGKKFRDIIPEVEE